jgi:hypothetical protein
MVRQVEGETSGEVFNREDLVEQFLQTCFQEPVETFVLGGQQIGERLDFGNLGKGQTLGYTRRGQGGFLLKKGGKGRRTARLTR